MDAEGRGAALRDWAEFQRQGPLTALPEKGGKMQLQFPGYGGCCSPSRAGRSEGSDTFPRLSPSLWGVGATVSVGRGDGGLIPALGFSPFPIQNGESERTFICEHL